MLNTMGLFEDLAHVSSKTYGAVEDLAPALFLKILGIVWDLALVCGETRRDAICRQPTSVFSPINHETLGHNYTNTCQDKRSDSMNY